MESFLEFILVGIYLGFVNIISLLVVIGFVAAYVLYRHSAKIGPAKQLLSTMTGIAGFMTPPSSTSRPSTASASFAPFQFNVPVPGIATTAPLFDATTSSMLGSTFSTAPLAQAQLQAFGAARSHQE